MSEKFMAEVKGFGQIEIYENETLESVYKRTVKEKGVEAYGAKCGNEVVKLIDKAEGRETIEFIGICDIDGRRIYSASASHILVKAVNDVTGRKCRLMIEHALNDNLYCEFSEKDIIVSDELLAKIEARMQEMVKADIPFVRERFLKAEAAKIYRQQNLEEKAHALKFLRYHDVNMYSLDGYYDYYYYPVVPSTGYVTRFDLVRHGGGFLLRLPSAKDCTVLNSYEDYEKISDVFMEQLRWCSLMHVNNVAELNECITKGGFEELVRINEALHEKKIAYIADMIADRKDTVKLVLIAGPSSSGKTTFAQRLCVQLRVNGITPHVIGMDDYFVEREDTPLDEYGKPDFESIHALDLDLFNNHMNALIRGEKVSIPSFNFVTGKKEYKGREIQLKEGDIIVCEGIHGLNDELTKAVAAENKFKIFISAITQLNIDSHNRVSTSDNRLIRRMVRDSRTRGKTAEKTIEGWASVRAGEEKNIFPYQHNADVMFNSSTIYELSVLKTLILPHLLSIDKSSEAYATASRLLKLLDTILAADGQCIPNTSIVKEFVGGSIF